MISGALIELFGPSNTFRAFALAGTVVLVILILAQYTASLLEQRANRRQEYDLLSESDETKSEEPAEILEGGPREEEALSKTTQ